MKYDFGTFLSELSLSPEVVGILNDYSLFTMQDLYAAYTEKGQLPSPLSDDQRIEIVKATWEWIKRPMNLKGETTS